MSIKCNLVKVPSHTGIKELQILQERKPGKILLVKFVEVLFTPTLNGIAVSVRCVSSTPVVLDARLND